MVVWLSIAVIVFVMLVYGYLSNYHLTTTTYELTTDGKTEDHTIVVLADLHCCQFGKDNHRLIKRIDDISPDYIFMPGDLVTKYMSTDHIKIRRMLSLVDTLSKKYPIYYSPGNHEIRLNDYDVFKEKLGEMGVIYLENRGVVFPDPGIKVYGLDLPISWYRSHDELTADMIGEFMGEHRADDEHINILLAHDPRYFDAFVEWGADLTLSGHLHGGILRLPFVGGVISPYLRLFPRYDAGAYEKDGKKMIISRGLGTHHVRFRFFNLPEILIIKINK